MDDDSLHEVLNRLTGRELEPLMTVSRQYLRVINRIREERVGKLLNVDDDPTELRLNEKYSLLMDHCISVLEANTNLLRITLWLSVKVDDGSIIDLLTNYAKGLLREDGVNVVAEKVLPYPLRNQESVKFEKNGKLLTTFPDTVVIREKTYIKIINDNELSNLTSLLSLFPDLIQRLSYYIFHFSRSNPRE